MTGVQQFGYTSNPGGLRALEGKLKHAPFTLYERIWKSLPGELWGRLQSAAGFSPPSRERCETCGRRTEVRRRLKPNAARISHKRIGISSRAVAVWGALWAAGPLAGPLADLPGSGST